MKYMRKTMFMLILIFLVGCKVSEVDESFYLQKIETYEKQITQLNLDINELRKEESVEIQPKSDPKTMYLVRMDKFIGNALLKENRPIKLSPYSDAETVVQLSEAYPVYVQYGVYNNFVEEWELVYYADSNIGYVLKEDLIDIEEPLNILSGTINASGIHQNRSVQELIYLFGNKYLVERREADAVIFDIEGISDLVLDYSKETGLVTGFSIRTSMLPLDSGFKVGDLLNDAIQYYEELYQYNIVEGAYVFEISETESLSFTPNKTENGEVIIGQIMVSK